MGYALVDKDDGLGLVWVAHMAAAGVSMAHAGEQGQVMGFAHVVYGSSHPVCGAGRWSLGLVVDLTISRAPCVVQVVRWQCCRFLCAGGRGCVDMPALVYAMHNRQLQSCIVCLVSASALVYAMQNQQVGFDEEAYVNAGALVHVSLASIAL